MLRWDTGGGALGIFVIGILAAIGISWLIAEVIAPIVCYFAPWCQ